MLTLSEVENDYRVHFVFLIFNIILKVIFHLQLLQNIEYIPYVVQYILEPVLHFAVCCSHSLPPILQSFKQRRAMIWHSFVILTLTAILRPNYRHGVIRSWGGYVRKLLHWAKWKLMVAQVEILAVDYTSSGQLSDVLKFEIINRISWFECGTADSLQVFDLCS